jgi:hypothetical protein
MENEISQDPSLCVIIHNNSFRSCCQIFHSLLNRFMNSFPCNNLFSHSSHVRKRSAIFLCFKEIVSLAEGPEIVIIGYIQCISLGFYQTLHMCNKSSNCHIWFSISVQKSYTLKGLKVLSIERIR